MEQDNSSPFNSPVLDATQQTFLRLVTRDILQEIAPLEEAFITPYRVRRLTRLALEQKYEVANEGAEYGMGILERFLSRFIIPILVGALEEYNKQRQSQPPNGDTAYVAHAITPNELRAVAEATGTPLSDGEYVRIANLCNGVFFRRAIAMLPAWRGDTVLQENGQRELQRMGNRFEDLSDILDVLSEKRSHLETAKARESNAKAAFQLKKEIEETQGEIQQLEAEYRSLKSVLRARLSDESGNDA